MMDDLLLGLKKIGLEEKVGKIYLALLSHPGVRAQELAEVVGLPRGTCYDLLDELVTRGFVSVGEGDGGRKYFPYSPEHLLTLLKMEERQVEDRIQAAESFIPMLTVLYNPSGPQPRVRYKEGIKGLKEMQKEYEALSGEILQLVGLDAFLALHAPTATTEHRANLVYKERKIRSIIITKKPELVPVFPHLETRVLPPEICPVTGELTVCEDRVTLFSYDQDMIALEICSPAIAGTCRATLELAWRQAGSLTGA